ncbi:MAG: hypothetical protein ABI876_07265 [Bacteroidota bacterium]
MIRPVGPPGTVSRTISVNARPPLEVGHSRLYIGYSGGAFINMNGMQFMDRDIQNAYHRPVHRRIAIEKKFASIYPGIIVEIEMDEQCAGHTLIIPTLITLIKLP